MYVCMYVCNVSPSKRDATLLRAFLSEFQDSASQNLVFIKHRSGKKLPLSLYGVFPGLRLSVTYPRRTRSDHVTRNALAAKKNEAQRLGKQKTKNDANDDDDDQRRMALLNHRSYQGYEVCGRFIQTKFSAYSLG